MPESTNQYLVTFNKPYQFEGKEYTEIDLTGIDNLTTEDLTQADKVFISSGNIATTNELSVGYACIIASKVSQKPIEFFSKMPAKEGIKIKNLVAGFFYEVG
ncbi:phage tail assembly protein [Mesobacillus thioparans]|uniref:phage tail assembly protein n=1 Tax=Mesobacillus thioparans TaxID=370439 RepID=UPI0039EF4374